MRRTGFAIGLLFAALFTRDAAAQWNVARFDGGGNRLYVTAGLDPAFVTSIGYARVIPVSGHAFQLAGDVGLATSRMDVGDFRARMELQSSILHWRSLHLAGRATFITRGTENSIYRGLNFGADFTGTAGVYRPGWFAAGEFGFDKAVVTHITHTDWYRTYYYPDAKDGWYLNAGGVFHYGLVGGIALGAAELVGRLGLRRSEDFEDLTPPVYASLGLGFGF